MTETLAFVFAYVTGALTDLMTWVKEPADNLIVLFAIFIIVGEALTIQRQQRRHLDQIEYWFKRMYGIDPD